jgi:phosphotransferase system HPr (HPr) family protein
MTSRTFRIVNEKGLHARASAKFVEVVEAHEARATVAKDGMEVSGDSIMGLLMLGASRGTRLTSRPAAMKRRNSPMRWRRLLRPGSERTIERRRPDSVRATLGIAA